MPSLFEEMTFKRGPAMKNRLMLAPMTNQQATSDGRLTAEELHWLELRARGNFGHVMTCCAHVNRKGQGFPQELGVYGDELVPGLTKLAKALRDAGAVSSMQLYHGGIRSIMPDRVGPSASPDDQARSMTLGEVQAVVEDFVDAAVRAQRAGFDGIELHGAHGYLISEFLSEKFNQREDEYGGNADKRRTFLLQIVEGIRARCRTDFQIGVRLSPERFGHDVAEQRRTAQLLCDQGFIDYLDISLWDAFKQPEDERYQGRTLAEWFTDLDKHGVRLGFAGKIGTREQCQHLLDLGADFVLIGRAAILHADFPERIRTEPNFRPVGFPVSAEYLRKEGLSDPFIRYLASWPNMVSDYALPEGSAMFDIDEFFRSGRGRKLA